MDNNYRDNRNKNGKNGPSKRPGSLNTIIIVIIAAVITLVGMNMLNGMIRNATYKHITYDEFLDKVNNGEVAQVELQSDKILIKPKAQETDTNNLSGVEYTYYTGYVSDSNLAQTLIDHD